MPSQQLVLDDFSGGFQPDGQPGALLDNQWAQLDGFVYDRERKIRSQWAEQLVNTASTWVWVVGFQGDSQDYLLAMDDAGSVQWAAAPDDDAVNASASVTFTAIGTVDTDKRPIGLVLHDPGDGVTNAMMVAKQGVDDVHFYHENVAGTALVVNTVTDIYPGDPTEVTDEYGQTGYTTIDDGAVPTANVAAMWGDYMVLADVTVKEDAADPLSATNAVRGRNALWVSEPGNYDSFNPAASITYIASQEATIVAMVEVDLGLMVFTTVADRTYDGVLLLRGSPTNYEVVSLRAGVGPSIELVDGSNIPQTGPHAALWPEVGSVVFAGAEGGIWHSQGTQMDRLDHYGPDRFPSDLTTDDWYIIGFREQVIVSRPDGVHVLRVFEEAGAWTKLVTATGGRPTWMDVLGACCYWIDSSDSSIRRWAPNVHAERGQGNGSELTLTVSTRTVHVDRHSTAFWHRAGVVCSSPESTGDVGTVTVRPSQFDDASGGELSTAVSTAVGVRGRFMVPGHGPSVEASVTATFTGDVVLEAVTLLARRGRAQR